MVQAAEHIIIEGCSLWDFYFHENYLDDDATVTLERFSTLVKALVPQPDFTSSGEPAYNLRIADFAMTGLSMVDQNYPPNFVRRLFAGDRVRIIDLRDREAVRGVQHMMQDELSQVMDIDVIDDWRYTSLQGALETYKAAASDLFPHARASFLHALAEAYHRHSTCRDFPKGNAPLPSPFRGGELDMEVTWVKELTKRIDIRPVHVFVRAEGMSRNLSWP